MIPRYAKCIVKHSFSRRQSSSVFVDTGAHDEGGQGSRRRGP